MKKYDYEKDPNFESFKNYDLEKIEDLNLDMSWAARDHVWNQVDWFPGITDEQAAKLIAESWKALEGVPKTLEFIDTITNTKEMSEDSLIARILESKSESAYNQGFELADNIKAVAGIEK